MPNEITRAWQKKLQAAFAADGKPDPLPKYGADGLGGAETQAAVIAYQRAHGLTVTGQWDDATLKMLNPAPHHIGIPPALIELGIETVIDAVIPPSPAKELLMNFFPVLVHTIIALLPQLPDDWAETEKDVGILASSSANAPDKLDAVANWATKLGEVLHSAAAAARGTAPTA